MNNTQNLLERPLKSMSFKAYFRETNKTDNECMCCYRKFTHIIDEHAIISYYHMLIDDEYVYIMKDYQFLIKCFQCTYIMCNNCRIKTYTIISYCKFTCPQCNISRYVQVNLFVNSASLHNKYALKYNYNWFKLYTCIAQSIYRHMKNPLKYPRNPLTIEYIENIKQMTENRFNDIQLNIETQRISGYIKSIYTDQYQKLEFPVKIFVSKEGNSFIEHNSQEIYNLVLETFKQDILNMYRELFKPIRYLFLHLEDYSEIQDFIDLMNIKNQSITMAQLGLVEFIEEYYFQFAQKKFIYSHLEKECRKVGFFTCVGPIKNSIKKFNRVLFLQMQSLENPYYCQYIINLTNQMSIGSDEMHLIREASQEEFINFFNTQK